jgi:hypothetical protein
MSTASYYPLKRFKRVPWRERRRDRFREGKQRLVNVSSWGGSNSATPPHCAARPPRPCTSLPVAPSIQRRPPTRQ